MKMGTRFIPLASLLLGFILIIFFLALPAANVRALPEYSAQTGEPCASCHISPSGGGPRGPRGQAWVGEGKPGNVPALIEALASLGVHLEIDPTYYQTVPDTLPEAQPIPVPAESAPEAKELLEWLTNFDGN